MRNRYMTMLAVLFGIVFIGSFAYLYVQQNFFPRTTSPVNGNTNTSITLNPAITGTTGTVMHQFASFDEYQKFISDHVADTSSGYGGALMRSEASAPTAGQKMIDAPQEFAGFSDQSISPAPDYSQTNVQVAGVDEADIIKSDGKYTYIVTGSKVTIVQAYPAEAAKIISTIDLKSQPQELYINGDYLSVYGTDQQIYSMPAYKIMPPRQSGFSFFKVFDLTDRANPKQVRDLTFEGYVASSRMIGEYVYMITTKPGYDLYGDPYPLPRMLENGALPVIDPKAADFRFPNVYYFDVPYDQTTLTSVNAINIKDVTKKVTTDVYVMDGAQTIYASADNLYITYTKYLDTQEIQYSVMKSVLFDRLPQPEKQKISQIEAAPNFILSKYERMAKVMQVIQRYITSLPQDQQDQMQKNVEERARQEFIKLRDQFEKTVVHKIALKDGAMTYKSFGEVPGNVINQYAMDEQGGYFRIATTKNSTWMPFGSSDTVDQDNKSYNNVYVMDENMKRVGSLERLAVDERIYSVRFMQHRAYMVTFKQVDPLFVIDLKDPKNPTVLGQLKIPGFSNYLHPYDEMTLIGFGKDTKEIDGGRVQTNGLKISLFDVSNVSEPKEIANYIFPSSTSDSEALYDPRAFLFSATKNLLVVPISDYGYDSNTKVFNGAQAFQIAKGSIISLGRIEHKMLNSSDTWNSRVRRSMYIEDVLYTLSGAYLKLNKLMDLADITSIELPINAVDYGVPIPMMEATPPSATGSGASQGSTGSAPAPSVKK